MKKSFISVILLSVLCLFPVLLTGCKSKAEKKLYKKELKTRQSALLIQNKLSDEETQKNQKLKSIIEKMPLEERISQLFIINLEGNTSFRSYETYDSFLNNGNNTPLVAGGYLFFSFNLCDSKEDQLSFVNSIKDYCKKHSTIYPFLAIDQEGGYVNRLRKLTGGLPSQESVAQKFSVEEAYELYSQQAVKMSELGFNMNLAPVIEVCTDLNKDFLDGRSFGDYDAVIDYGIACVNAYENNNIAAVIKHFPGNTNTDPHTGLPEIKLSLEELEESIEPFVRVMDMNPSGILMSHARTSAVDKDVPGCLSKIWVTEKLRNEYGYKGIIFSDDIFMGALQQNGYSPEKACVMAIEAGIDCIMISEKRFAKPAAVLYKKALEDKAFEERINESVYRILSYKQKAGIYEAE